jgi:hypothetical protein
MVYDGRNAATGCLQCTDKGAEIDRFRIQCAIQPPPDLLQDLEEIPGRLNGTGHSAGEARIEVRVRADQTRHEELAIKVLNDVSFFRQKNGALLRNTAAGNSHIDPLQCRRGECRTNAVFQQY